MQILRQYFGSFTACQQQAGYWVRNPHSLRITYSSFQVESPATQCPQPRINMRVLCVHLDGKSKQVFRIENLLPGPCSLYRGVKVNKIWYIASISNPILSVPETGMPGVLQAATLGTDCTHSSAFLWPVNGTRKHPGTKILISL